jgi:CRP/FNR family cyclic AMP-dependent transcriptional regulator
MVIIYGLLRKLREANQELAFERKSDVGQDDIDDLVADFMKG